MVISHQRLVSVGMDDRLFFVVSELIGRGMILRLELSVEFASQLTEKYLHTVQ